MAKPTNGSDAAKARGAKVLEAKAEKGEEREATLARLALSPGPRHAALGSTFAASLFSSNHSLGITECTAVVGDAMAKARNGDKALASDILAAQAVALDAMFTELAGRSAKNMGQYLDAAERYMRLALKTQANCRATLEALGKLHQPREQTVKHVHVNQGGQAIVADQIHQHAGGTENGKTSNQSHATHSECSRTDAERRSEIGKLDYQKSTVGLVESTELLPPNVTRTAPTTDRR